MGIIYGRGWHQDNFVTLIALMRTDFIGACAKLDNDATVNLTNYESTLTPAAIQSLANGLNAGTVYDDFKALNDALIALLTKLDGDTGVTDVNYLTTWTTGTLSSNNFETNGQNMGDTVAWLNKWITNFNGALTKLDNDGGVTDEDYNATWAVPDTVDEAGTAR